MIEPATLNVLRDEVRQRISDDRYVLDEMREEVRPLRSLTRRIQPRAATAISLVGTDGGSNQLIFDPFKVELVRVVDSSNNEYCLEAITPRSSLTQLSERHLGKSGHGKTALGRMMEFLEIRSLHDLSPVFSLKEGQLSKSWTNVYREMTEWAVLFDLVRNKDFGTDTVIVCDGFLRSKMFAGKLFGDLRRGMEDAIRRHYEKARRRIYVCGIAKNSNVLQSYRVALALEGVLRNAFSCYVEVPEVMEERVYKWDEYLVRSDKFVAGKMFLVKFGGGMLDPVWAVDLLQSQKDDAQTIFGYLLEDAKDGFPIPYYPQCLQKAHESAALVDFDLELLQDQIKEALREAFSEKRALIDELSLQESDPAARRY